MPSTYKKILRYGAIAIGTILAGIYSIPLYAQTPIPEDSTNLENISVGDDFDWNFPSENEPATVKDDIRELEEYSITEDNGDLDVELEEEKRWGNQGDVENKSFEIEVYDY